MPAKDTDSCAPCHFNGIYRNGEATKIELFMGGSKSKKAVEPQKARRRHSNVSGYDSMAWGANQAATTSVPTDSAGSATEAAPDTAGGPIATPARGRVRGKLVTGSNVNGAATEDFCNA